MEEKQTNYVLMVKDLRVSYHTYAGEVQSVRGVSFELETGKALAIVGESGCGKSVTAKSIMGLIKGPAGEIKEGSTILYNGDNILNYSKKQWQAYKGGECAIIFQDALASLNPTMRVGKQIMENLMAHKNMDKKSAQKEAVEMLRMVGIPEPEKRVKQYPHEFSGGMRQRVIIALATFISPNVVLADEPTTALDVVVQKGILKMLMRLQKQLKNTMVIVSHDMGVHYQITDRMAIMYSGSIIELGPTDAIFNDPIHPYTKMLVDSLPRVGDKSQKVGIPGRPPALKNPPPGCRFAARCPHATDRCRQEIPEFIEVKPGRFAACHLLKKEGEKNG